MENLFEGGLKLFNEGKYFEAHEVWEDLWRETQGPARLFYQGLIQAAAGLHHLNGGNLTGARGQLRKSLAKLEQFGQNYCGIDNARLATEIRQVLEDLKSRPVRILRPQ